MTSYSDAYDYVFNGIRPNPLAQLPDFSPVPLPAKGDQWTGLGDTITIVDVAHGGRIITWKREGSDETQSLGLSDFLGRYSYLPPK